MTVRRVRCAVAAILGTLLAGGAFALARIAGGEGAESPSTAAAEHREHLRMEEGVWDATIELTMGPPGTAPMTSKGVETNQMSMNGLWLLSDLESEIGGAAFRGHGVFGYDSKKGRYVGVWVDSMTDSLTVSDGTCEDDGKRPTLEHEGTDVTGAPSKVRETIVFRPDGTRVFTMSTLGPDGSETETMRITYTKRAPG